MTRKPEVHLAEVVALDSKKSGLPTIDAKIQDLSIVTPQAWSAVEERNSPPFLFRRGSELFRLEGIRRPELRRVGPDILRHEMARAANWIQRDDHGTVGDAMPPVAVVRDALATPEPPLPTLNRIVEVPVFALDGSLETAPGYHPASRNYLALPEAFNLRRVAKRPSPGGHVRQARLLLLNELLVDFPFVRPADQAHAVALFLLPFARDLICGPTPNHLIEAPAPGSGKGLLSDVLLIPGTGRPGVMPQATSDEEWRKRITATVREGAEAILIDNVTGALNSGTLAAALTADVWKDRLLGKNESVRLPVRCAWVTTANNPQLSTEIARRSVRIRLDPQCERPWRRETKSFKHPNLREWARNNRARLVWAAHTLIRAWLAHGRQEWKGNPLGSYESWSAVIGGILQVAEIEGFLGNLDEFYEVADLESGAWRELVDRWSEEIGLREVKVADLLPLARKIEGFGLDGRPEHAQKVSFGSQLARKRDCVIGGYRITLSREAQRAKHWKLLPVSANEQM